MLISIAHRGRATAWRTAGAIAIALVLSACQTVPDTPAELAAARSAIAAAEHDSTVAATAPLQLQQARDALARAERHWSEERDVEELRTLAHVARQRAEIARAVAARQVAEARVQQAEAERARVRAEVTARQAQRERERTVLAQQEVRQQQQQVATARSQLDSARERSRRLEAELQALQAKQTDRGLVITLDDVLFDTGEANLRGGSMRSIQRIAAVLRDHPERRVLIEGYTDSQGSASFNLDLAERRAEAVRTALLAQGVAPPQIQVRAFGEANPVASNDTAAGRQLNRRVEIVFSDAEGRFRVQ